MNVVATYIFNNAEILRDPLVVTPNTKYVVFTDNCNAITSSIWEPVVVSNPVDIRAQVAMAKFNPFIIPAHKYIVIDASHQIKANLTSVFDQITDTMLCVKEHPAKVTIREEICRWRTIRHMSDGHIANITRFLDLTGTDLASKPIYEGCFIGLSNSTIHQNVFAATLYMLKLLQYNNVWFPSNQIALSTLIHKLAIPRRIINVNEYANRYYHNTWTEIKE